MWFIDSIAKQMTETLTNAIDAERLQQQSVADAIADPFAQEIGWTPLVRGGASFKTRDIVMDPATGNLEFRASFGAKLFSGFFLGIGLLMDAVFVLGSIKNGSFDTGFIGMLVFSSIFSLVGAYMLMNFSKPIVFDRQTGYFRRGKQKEAYGMPDPTDKNVIPLSSIHAIQIITERVQTKNSSYPSYEINLVLKDKTRVNIVDHGNLVAIQSDSKQLGEYLGVPVWGG